MPEKPPLWADLLLTVWVGAVGVVALGGYFFPRAIGDWTGTATVCYALMLAASVLTLAVKYLTRSKDGDTPVSSTQDRN